MLVGMAMAVQQASIDNVRLPLQPSPKALALSANGVETIRLTVAPDGTIAGCNAQVANHGPIEDRDNCRKLLTLKAIPASDQAGTSLHGMLEFRLSWKRTDANAGARADASSGADLYLPLRQMPDGARDDATTNVNLVVAADGKVETCEPTSSSGNIALDKAACQAVMRSGTQPLNDATGTPVRAVQTLAIGFSVQP